MGSIQGLGRIREVRRVPANPSDTLWQEEGIPLPWDRRNSHCGSCHDLCHPLHFCSSTVLLRQYRVWIPSSGYPSRHDRGGNDALDYRPQYEGQCHYVDDRDWPRTPQRSSQMGRLYNAFPLPGAYDPVLCDARMGPRRTSRIQNFLQSTLLHLRYRSGSIGPSVCLMPPFTPIPPEMVLRAVRHPSRSNLDCIPGHVILALQQLPHLMGIPLGDSCHLAGVLVLPRLLPQLDKPAALVMAHW